MPRPLSAGGTAGVTNDAGILRGVQYDWMDNTSAERTCKQACVPARVHCVSDGGHHMYFENPGGFNAILREEIASA